MKPYGQLSSGNGRAVALILACHINLLVFAAGCAVSQPIHKPGLVHGITEPVGNTQKPAPAIDVSFQARQFYNGRLLRHGLLALGGKHDSKNALARQARYFPFLNIGSTGAAYRLQIESTQSMECHWTKAIVPAMTFYMLPFDSEYKLGLKGLLYHQEHLLKTYHASASFTISIQSWRIVIPWTWGLRVPDRAYEDTYADLFLQIQHDLPQFN